MAKNPTAPQPESAAAGQDVGPRLRTPTSPALSCRRLEAIDALLEQHIVQAGVAPGATAGLLVRKQGRLTTYVGAAGRLGHDMSATTPDTLYDLASLTKPLVAAALAALHRRAVIDLRRPLSAALPSARGLHAGAFALQALMAHRAALLPHLELFLPHIRGHEIDREEALRRCAEARDPDHPGGTPRCLYSDLGYLLLGRAIEQQLTPYAPAFSTLDHLVTRELHRLGVYGFGSARQWEQCLGRDAFLACVAATEDVPYRGGVIRGRVHDDNAWALAGSGAAGHAGFFAAVHSVMAFGDWLLLARAGSASLDPVARQVLFAPRRGGGHLGGFDTKNSKGNSSAGTLASDETFGHLGFTGTSFWCDPKGHTVVVLLTNRVHPSRENQAIRGARPLLNDALRRLSP